MNATDQLIRTYTERNYIHTATVRHRGTVIAFAMDVDRRLWYAVLHLEGPDGEQGVWDVKHWPDTPQPVPFVNEIGQVGHAVAGTTAMPSVRLGSDQEAQAGTLLPEEVDPFASSTARLTAAEPFSVFSDERHVYIFRQSISAEHVHAVFKCNDGGASSAEDADYVLDAQERKIPLVADTLLCDRYVLSGPELKNKREIRYRRSRNKSLPASGTDSLGASDMEGKPFYEPTHELAFVRHLHGGRFTVLQLPTTLQDVKRWQVFADNKKSGRLDSFNLEVSDDGLFDPLGTQLYTSPQEQYKGSVLEREPGRCPMSGEDLVPVAGRTNFAETGLSFSGGSQHVAIPSALDGIEQLCLELWVRPSNTSLPDGTGVFASCNDPAQAGSFQVEAKNGRWRLVHTDATVDLGPVSGDWQHLSVSYDQTSLRGYQGGVLVEEAAAAGLTLHLDGLRLGNDRAASKALLGILDEVRLWDRARDGDEIKRYAGQRLLGQEPGLVAYFRLDEGSGEAVYDQTDRAQHGALVDEPQWVSSDAPVADHAGIRRSSFRLAPPTTEVTGSTPAPAVPAPAPPQTTIDIEALSKRGALSFNGTSSFVRLDRGVRLGASFCMELWIKPQLPDNSYYGVIGGGDALTDRGPCLFLFERTTIHTGITDSSSRARKYVDAPSALTDNAWQHVAITFDGTTYTIYVNGQSALSTSWTGVTSLDEAIEAIGQLAPFYYKGEMADVRLWSRARSQEELRANMGKRLLGDEPELEGYWPLNEGTGSTAKDWSRHENHGTLIANPVWKTDGPILEAPPSSATDPTVQPSTALRFDGVDDYLTTQQPLLNDRSAFTISGWIKHEAQSKNVAFFGQNDTVEFGLNAQGKLSCWMSTGEPLPAPTGGVATVYQYTNYGGRSQRLGIGRHSYWDLAYDIGNDAISSIRVPPGLRVTLWGDSGYRGGAHVYTQDAPQLIVDNAASSAEVELDPNFIAGSQGVVFSDSVAVPSGTWHHVALTVDGQKLRLYLNGSLRAETSYDASKRANSSDPFCIGGRVWLANTQDAFKGEMAEVRVWDHARNADQLRAGMGHVLLGTEPGLIGYWPIQKQVSGDLPDLKGSASARRMSSPSWVSTDKQLQSHPSILAASLAADSQSNASFLGAGASGMAAALYYQQESAFSATQTQGAPFKKSARVMLALNVASADGYSHVAAIDFAVGRDGRLALVPDTLPLASIMPQEDTPTLEDGLSMPLLHTDPRGLTLSGALLGFAPSSHRPTLNDSATGKLGLYFRHVGGTSSVAYFDTHVERLRFALPSEGSAECQWLTRSANSDAITLTVRNGSNANTCEVTIEASARGLTETWRDLPRDATAASAVINGQDAGYDLAKATISDANMQLHGGSILLRALPCEPDVRLVNGSAQVLCEGRTGRWIGDGPGEAMDFAGTHVLTTSEGVEAAALPDRLTVEAWVQPHARGGGGVVALHSDGERAYAMALHEQGEVCFPIVGVKTGDAMPWQWRQGQEPLPSGKWHHLTLRFEQSHGVRFSSRSQLAVAHAEALDLSADMTIEVALEVDAVSGVQLLLSKGGPSAQEDQSLPYALLIDGSGHLVFTFESERGQSHTYASRTRLNPGFHRVAVTRKTGQRQRQSSESGDVSYQGHDGATTSMPSTMIQTMGEDPWYEITFHIDDQHERPHRYEGPRPLGNDQPLLIGGDGLSRHLLGTLCEVRLWNVARDTRSVNRPVGRRERGLTGWWNFKEGRGNVTYDTQGTHHGRLIAGEWVNSPQPGASRVELWHGGLPTPSEAPASSVRSMLDTDALANPQAQLSLGSALKDGALTCSLRAGIEEVRVWRTLRSPEQVVDNLFCRLKGDKQDLLAYYPFDVESTAEQADAVLDHSLRGLHLRWPSDAHKPTVQPSSAPIGHDMPSVRSALTGVDTRFHLQVDTAAAVEEYGDLQQDARGNTFGVLKRAYGYLEGGRWHLFTGYKIGDLVSEWIGQAQFDPQVVGYLEGIPPVPSENMTEGQMDPRTMNWADIGLMASVELTESDSVSYTLGSNTEGSHASAFERSASAEFDNDVLFSIAPLGFGKVVKALQLEANVGASQSFSSESGWSSESTLGTQINRTRTLSASMGGSWEGIEAAEQLNPDLGRRLLVGNVGFALVQSETADIYAMRLRHTNALVSFRMVPNPDVPKDWNVISFPINPLYTKQGTLDGRVGYDKNGSVVYDPDYANATGYGEYSYYKPKEAYALQRRIQQEEQSRLQHFATKGVDKKKFKGNKMGALAGQAASLILKDLSPDTARTMANAQQDMGGGEATFQELPARHAKRNIVNTYVWTADGGYYEEETGTTDTRTQSASGNFSFTSSQSISGGVDFKVFGVGMGIEMEASMSGALSITRTRDRESETTFGLDVELDVPGDLQRYHRDDNQDWIADGNNYPGKVDAYRFKTFYLDSDKRNYEDLFGKVIDPMWLAESTSPTAVALRQAQNADKKPACWRVFHRVTFVSRVLPDYTDATVAPLESAMQAQNIGSNWQLIKTLEPFVKNKTADPIAFADATRDALRRYLPELVPHTDAVLDYLRLYYGVS